MDYKKLLEAYIDSIITHESTPFVHDIRGEVQGLYGEEELTHEEQRELCNICDERYQIYTKRLEKGPWLSDEAWEMVSKVVFAVGK